MPKLIICDWNRTLYEPKTTQLIPETISFLETLRNDVLVLISAAETDNTSARIKNFGLKKYFAELYIGQKNKELFLKLKTKYQTKQRWIVGDKIDSEIYLGNLTGYQTIRIKQGKFKNLLPKNQLEIPNFTVSNLSEALAILLPA